MGTKNKNKIISETTPPASDTLFGGPKVRIPANGSHAGQSGWASGNAWDIPAEIGTPVYAIASGTLQTFNDYGPIPKRVNGKVLFGIGFTVKSDNRLPDVYYTHLKNCTVKKGDHVNCGQLLGYVMDFPGSSYDHLHIGVEWGHDVREFLTSDGKIKCNGKPIPLSPIGGPTTQTTTESSSPLGAISDSAEELYNEIINFKINGLPVKTILGITATSLGAITKIDFLEVLKTFAKTFKGLRRIPPEELEK